MPRLGSVRSMVVGDRLAAFDRQGKAIGCEPPARDERVCPPGGELSRLKEYRRFCHLGGHAPLLL